MATTSNYQDNDNVFLDTIECPKKSTLDNSPQLGMLDPTGSSSSSNSRKPSYDSRESKSISECSYVSGSPCDSPMRPLGLTTPFSSTCTMESDIGRHDSSNIIGEPCLDPFQSEKEFIDYLMSLPTSKTEVEATFPEAPVTSSTALPSMDTGVPQKPTSLTGSQSPKIGLDHLENLCKLMEQLGVLREQNFKLQKRVQYLEEVRCLNEMRKDLKEALEVAISNPQSNTLSKGEELGSWEFLPEVSTQGTARQKTAPKGPMSKQDVQEMVCDSENTDLALLPASETETKRAKSCVKMRKSAVKKQQRLRSQSMGDDDIFRKTSPTGIKAKVSKWTKVKEALKWERVQVENRNISGGATSDGCRSSFFVDIEDDVQQPIMVSKATVILTPATKKEKRLHTSDKSQHKISKGRSKMESIRDRPSDNKEGIGTLHSPYFIYDPYFELSSDDDEENTTKDLDPREKRRSIGATLELDVVDGDSLRRQTSSNKLHMPHDTLLDEDQAIKDRKGRSLERIEPEHREFIRYTQSEKECKKMSKGAWGKVKNIIQTRKDSLKRKHRKSGGFDVDSGKGSAIESDYLSNEYFGIGDGSWADRYDITSYGRNVAEDDRLGLYDPVVQVKSKHSSSSSNYGGEDFCMEFIQENTKTRKGKAQMLTIQVPPEEPCPVDSKHKCQSTTPPTFNITTTGYSPNSQRKSKWNKVKNVFLEKRKTEMGLTPQRPQSVPASPTNLNSFTYEDLGLLEEYLLDAKNWVEKKDNRGIECGPYDSSVAALQTLLADKMEPEVAPMPMPAETKRNLEELQRNITHDFSKKMQEWEKLKTTYTKQQQNLIGQGTTQQQTSPKLNRKGSGQKSRKGKSEKTKEKMDREQKSGKQREKELQWLEKQLQKIDREKQRLAKERQKYMKREARLEKMKETMMNPSEKKEILVRTSAGEFRFEGISQTFTRKLYEWEEMKGIGPEVSTIALLDAQHPDHSPLQEFPTEKSIHTLSPPVPRYGRLDHNRSRSESSLADIVNVQTSTTSLAPDDLVDDVFSEGLPHSRAASEPDIVYDIDESPCAMEVEELHFEESIPCMEIPEVHIEEPVYSYAPSEVTRLIDSSGSSDAEKDISSEGHYLRKSSACRVKEPITIPEEGMEGTYGNIQEEDIKLLRKLTAKEEICRQLENDLEDLDGRMKMMFQQHSEEIQKLKSQEAINSEEKQEPRTTSPGSPVDTMKQKQLIEELRARIEELERAGDSLLKERENLEQTFKINSDQQAQLTQHLAARITELQQKNAKIHQIATDQKLGEKLSGQSKKKQGVVKVQEISAELLKQAKTLEQALLDRNATIHQLQWELLQRDMSAMQLQNELQMVKDKTGDVLGGIKEFKKKEKNDRSWSSVDNASISSRKQEEESKILKNQKPMNLPRYTDNQELAVRPLELTQKVRELKTELMRLWSSTESATSGSSDHAVEDIHSEKDVSSNSSDTLKAISPDEPLPMQIADNKVNLSSYEFPCTPPMPRNDVDHEVKVQPTGKASRTSSGEEVVTARRVSDTSIPQDIRGTPDPNKQQKSTRSKLPRSPEVNSSKHKEKTDNGEKSALTEQPMSITSKIPSRICPLSPPITVRSTLQSNDELQSTNATALSITLSLKPKPAKTAEVQAVRPERTSKLKKMAAVVRPPTSSEEKEAECNLGKSESVILQPIPTVPSSTIEEPNTSAVVILPRKMPPKSQCLSYQQKSPSKEHRAVHLQRQNAEDVGSSSDTDTEGSGITFTINLSKKDESKLKDTIATTKMETLTAKIPLRKADKSKESGLPTLGCTSPSISRPILESKRVGGITSSPQSPSVAPWRKLSREDNKEEKTCPEVVKSLIPTPSGTSRMVPESPGSPQVASKLLTEAKACGEEVLTAPETPVVKSRSTRKLKLPTAGKAEPSTSGGTPSSNGLEPSMLRTRRVTARPVKEAAPNVKSMIEKYNKKLAEQPPVSLLRSPQLGSPRMRIANGVQKSISFTDPSIQTSAGESVVKSASTSTIEVSNCGPGSPAMSRIPPMSPESLKRTASMGQPIGIASRIPRGLKSISEQDSNESTIKDDIGSKQSLSDIVQAPDSPGSGSVSRTSQVSEAILQSPNTGVRAIQMRRARDEFLTKAPSSGSASPALERHAFTTQDSDGTSSPASAPLRPSGWNPFCYRVPMALPETQTKRPSKDPSDEELSRPKGILKATRKEIPWITQHRDNEPMADTVTSRILKSASAGAMEDATTRSTSSDDGSRVSDSLPHAQKSGLFHFKFRKAKIKQKKEPLSVVKALCRQSLLVDIEPGSELVTSSAPLPGVSTRSCPSSPEQSRPGGKTGWLSKPRTLFKSK